MTVYIQIIQDTAEIYDDVKIVLNSLAWLEPQRPKAVENWPYTASCPVWLGENSPAGVFCAVMDKLCSPTHGRGFSATNFGNSRCCWYEYITKCIQPTVITEVTNFRKVHYSSKAMLSPWLDLISPISKLFLHKHVF